MVFLGSVFARQGAWCVIPNLGHHIGAHKLSDLTRFRFSYDRSSACAQLCIRGSPRGYSFPQRHGTSFPKVHQPWIPNSNFKKVILRWQVWAKNRTPKTNKQTNQLIKNPRISNSSTLCNGFKNNKKFPRIICTNVSRAFVYLLIKSMVENENFNALISELLPLLALLLSLKQKLAWRLRSV